MAIIVALYAQGIYCYRALNDNNCCNVFKWQLLLQCIYMAITVEVAIIFVTLTATVQYVTITTAMSLSWFN